MFKTIVASAAIAIASLASAAQATELKIALGIGPKHPIAASGYESFVKELEARTKGSVTGKFFMSGALLSIRGALAGLKDGVGDMAIIVYSYYPAEMPAYQVISELQNLGKENAATSGASSEFTMLHCAQCQKEYAANGLVQLSGYAGPSYVIISKSKIETLADISGKKIRSGGGSFSAWARAVGALDVNMPVDDMYQGFSSGAIDAGVQTQAAVRTYGFWDTAKHVTDLPVGIISATSIFTVSRLTWKDLKPAERAAMLQAASVGMGSTIKAYDEEVSSIAGPAKDRGVQFHKPAPDLLARTKQFDQEQIQNAIGILRDKLKVANAEQLVNTYIQLLDKWTKLVEPVKTDYVAIKGLMDREIYAKIDAARWGM
ncbi:MAG: C4-dicarboxylate TRAP transporter substrate-binding protein [Alphaproteobacteria bacterium]